MKRIWWQIIFLSVLISTVSACKTSYSNPPADFRDLDLVGTWEAHYSKRRIDKLIIRADGTFKQIYQDSSAEGHSYETSWNKWWVERFRDGRIWLHLQGARYYLAGIEIAKQNGMGAPCPEELPDCGWASRPRSFYDPFAKESLPMVGKLILNVQINTSGELVLPHMWISSDRGFALIGRSTEEFHRAEIP